jgi:hypothetical protein
MSNVLNKNPLVIDTAGATVLFTDILYIKEIRWVVGVSGVADDGCSVTDQNSNVIFAAFASAKDTEYSTYFGAGDEAQRADGLIVPTLAHGKLYIYLA